MYSATRYRDAAGGSPFILVVVQCEFEEHMRRATSRERSGSSSTKITDIDALRDACGKDDIYAFGDGYELELDVTHLSPAEAARKIHDHVNCVTQARYTSAGRHCSGWCNWGSKFPNRRGS